MNKNNILTIDLNVYCTQTQYAKDKNMRLATVSQQVKRALAGEGTAKVEPLHIPELGITLVKKP